MKREQVTIGARLQVAIDSWAGRTLHRVQVLSVSVRYARVEWQDDPAFGRQPGNSYRVPLSALRDQHAAAG